MNVGDKVYYWFPNIATIIRFNDAKTFALIQTANGGQSWVDTRQLKVIEGSN